MNELRRDSVADRNDTAQSVTTLRQDVADLQAGVSNNRASIETLQRTCEHDHTDKDGHSMAIQPPTGVKARFAPGWAYLTVAPKNGHSIEVEYSTDDSTSWHAASTFGAEYLVPMYNDPRRTEWRARYKRAESVSTWTTGKVGSPDFFQEDSDHKPNPDPTPDTPPAAPNGVQVTAEDATAGTARIEWSQTGTVDHWEVKTGSGEFQPASGRDYVLRNLTPGTAYEVQVRAVGKGNSGLLYSPATTHRFVFQADVKPDPDPDTTVATPRNVRAHCIAPTSTKLEWDRDPVVHEYEVWLDAAQNAAQRTQDTLVSVKGLKPETQYTAHVVAHTADGRKSQPGSIVFKTGSPEPAPDPDPDVDVKADWPAPDLMVWPIENGKVRATWDDPDDGSKPKSAMGYPFWHVSVDQRTWYFTKTREFEFEVAPGAEVMFSVYGVWDNTLTAIATKGAAL
ncbi:fibronectin type III domain-containing protein [Halosaccharopolyspora lacisalsi]|nr:fibronectin type III domain-containing protein [Halosaccharopolyspora lacisalsi]